MLPTIDRYILGQLAGSFLFFMLVFTGVIWLGLSLKLVEIVVNNARSGSVFFELAALLMPRVMVIVLPIASFAAALFVVNRMAGDSEMVALAATGVSGRRVLRPVIISGTVVTMLVLVLSVLVTPPSQRRLKARIAEVKGDVAAAFLREGVFETPRRGITVYLRRLGRPGEMLGIFVQDERDPDQVATYTAQRAVLLNAAGSARLVMFDGIVQLARAGAPDTLSILRFDKLAYDLGQLGGGAGPRAPKPSELSLHDLLTIGPGQTGGRPLGSYRAEAHEMLSGPLYALALPLLAFALVSGAPFRRQGFLAPVAVATVAAVALRLLGLGLKGAVAGAPALWPTLYLPPLAGIAFALWRTRRTGRGRWSPGRTAAWA